VNSADGRHGRAARCSTTGATAGGFLVEHLANGDMFDSTPGAGAGTVHRFGGWPRADLRIRRGAISMIGTMCDDNEFDINRLVGRLKEANSLLSQSFEPMAPGGSKLAPAQLESPLSPPPPVSC